MLVNLTCPLSHGSSLQAALDHLPGKTHTASQPGSALQCIICAAAALLLFSALNFSSLMSFVSERQLLRSCVQGLQGAHSYDRCCQLTP